MLQNTVRRSGQFIGRPAVGPTCEDGAVLLADVVAASAAVAATRARTAKATVIADVLKRADPDEVPPVTAWLSGEPLQSRLGVGWRTLSRLAHEPVATPRLSGGTVDGVLAELAATSGAGSAARREALLAGLFGAATGEEQRFLVRLLAGELRQGALEGVVLDAVAAAADVPPAAVRRAFMLSGSLPGTASTALTGGTAALDAVGLEVGRPVRPMLASPAGSLDAALADLGAGVSV